MLSWIIRSENTSQILVKVSERKYHSPKLEFLGVKWAACKQFRD